MTINYLVLLHVEINKEESKSECLIKLKTWNEAVTFVNLQKETIQNKKNANIISLINSKSKNICDEFGKTEIYKIFYKSGETGTIYIATENF